MGMKRNFGREIYAHTMQKRAHLNKISFFFVEIFVIVTKRTIGENSYLKITCFECTHYRTGNIGVGLETNLKSC